MSEIKRIGVMTGGGDCPGLNAVIRAVVKTAILKYGLEVVGIKHGYRGLYLGEDEFVPLTLHDVSGIISKGGTMLYSSNKDNLFDYSYIDEHGQEQRGDVSDVGVNNLKKAGIDALIVIGGDGTLTSGRDFARKGVKVIGVPKTIDNDLASTDTTFGFDTAVATATESIDKLRTTAESHSRTIVVEVMGRYAGFIAIASAIAGGADAALIPEIPYDINKVADAIKENRARGKNFAIVVVAEGAKPKDGTMVVKKTLDDGKGLDNVRLGGIGDKLAEDIEHLTGMVSRNTTLGYVQRGGTPTAFDRVLSTKYGYKAMELALEGKFNVLVTLKGGKLGYVPLEEVVGKNKEIGARSGGTESTNIKTIKMDDDLIKVARNLGICLGD